MGDHRTISIADQIFELLERDILSGKYPRGEVLSELRLSEELGVSRTPVREAIRKLEKEGLVTIEPRKGAYASDISIKEMVDVLEVRQYLESLAAGMAASRITPEEKLKLQEATDAYKQAIESEDTSEIIKWDENFHKIIVDCSGNKTLIQMISQVQELALRFRYIYYDDFSRYKNQPLEHQEIEEAIMNGNVEKARKEANEHLARLKEFVMLQGEKIVKGGQ